jgi:hypothetical protein
MKVVTLNSSGVRPAQPVKAVHPGHGEYLRFEHGEEGRGRKLVFFPLAVRDFPSDSKVPPDQEFKYTPGSFVLRRGCNDGEYLVLWDLEPGFRGSASYEIEGGAVVIAEGREAQGMAGRMGGAPCPVLLVSGPCTLRWTRTGRLYGSPPHWRAKYDGSTWIVEPDDKSSDAVAEAFS